MYNNQLTLLEEGVLFYIASRKKINKYVCSCGKITYVSEYQFKSNRTKSCGCLRMGNSTKHNLLVIDKKVSGYHIWSGIRARCLHKGNKRYVDYGGRGITLCLRWNSFKNFYEDMGPRPSLKHSIDRIDNNKGYCKENCRWATHTEQMNNTRKNRLLTLHGVTKNVTEWSKYLNMNINTIRNRLNKGWPVDKVLKKFIPKSVSKR